MSDGLPSFGYAGAFVPSRSRKKRKGKGGVRSVQPSVLMDRTMEEIATGDWLQQCKEYVKDCLDTLQIKSPEVLSLGLGSPVLSRDARAQLAFLLAVCDGLSIDRTSVSIYDPVFTDEDIDLLDTLRVTRLTEDKRAAYRLRAPTLVFMPHCDVQLYENLLRENWSQAGLPNLVLIANRLSEYADNVPTRKLSVEHPCVWRLTVARYLAARALPICPAYPTAFNNTSIQYARVSDIGGVGDEWWELPLAHAPGAANFADARRERDLPS
ncbi:uncharacterized protein LAESUDRAFT_720709 [Laetiporus sulphureus 93-53]|uniref:SRR1-like domain-containing protein n=1 Tax=Laetiporus sulphureus 93-53 TaxID=1314785 RepID=A0A165HAJ1_9APHY|nr:uncharacterized protein LAESUDRAFT_720709 [Laetiporus sulphureus 93-53]KZT11469.1 hypothetical protein LAESUDRAFT_720709 [Laetiporus sulphureus 93-53]